MYIYIYIYIHVCIHVFVYTLVHDERRRPRQARPLGAHAALTEGTLGTPVNLLVSSQKCQGVPFSIISRDEFLLQQPH